jgi:hypothetical protein
LGKWSSLREILEKAPEDPTNRDKINLVKANLADDLATLGNEYRSVRDLKDDIKEFLSDVEVEIQAYTEKIVATLEENQLKQIRLNDGTSITIKDDVYTQVVDKPKWFRFIKENGLISLLSVHYQTMNGLVKERFEKGENVPDGLKATIKSGLLLRRKNGEE